MILSNIFRDIPETLDDEFLETILMTPAFRLEKIVSSGHATPHGEWFDQALDEWVVLLSGSAGLLFEGEGEPTVMYPGDSLLIPAHVRHRVDWTDPSARTVWLALHYNPDQDREAGI